MKKNDELLKGISGMAASLKNEEKKSIKAIKDAAIKHKDKVGPKKNSILNTKDVQQKKIGRPSVRKSGVRYKRLSIDIPVETFQKLKLAMGHEKNFERQQWEIVDELINKGINEYL